MSAWTAGGWPRFGPLNSKGTRDESVTLWSWRTEGLHSGLRTEDLHSDPRIKEVLDLSLGVGVGEQANG